MRIALLVFVLAACAARSPVGELRFHNQPPVWRVDDRAPLPRAPAKREYIRALYHVDGFVVRRATRAMELRPHVRARDVNALDEVPDSTWFTNRIGVRDLTLDELRVGPNVSANPFDHRPWTITGMKVGGMSLGFVFEDAAGGKHLLKFDPRGEAELETGAHVIVHRILWAIGYNVPEDHVGHIRRADLRIAAGAKMKRAGGKRVPLTAAALDDALARVARMRDGTYRVLASRFVDGKPLGPYAREGTRRDDANDVIPHEQRRSLRGQRAIFAWLGHTDIQEDQTIDVFRDGHVVHYLLDFGKALGVMAYHMKWRTVGHTYRIDPGVAAKSLFTLGLWKRPWDGLGQPPIPGVGLFDAAHYDPGTWRPNSLFWPLEDADRHDGFWGAKLAMRFSRAQLEAIVAEARYTDPRAAAYLVDTLIARQRATARYYFDRVAPLDDFTIERDRLCFRDLTLAYGLRDVATRYVIETYDHAGRAIAAPRTTTQPCAPLALAPAADGYTIMRVRVFRNAHEMPAVLVHVARDDAGVVRVIGVRRR